MANSYEQQQLDLAKENAKLKAELAGYRQRVCQMCDGHGLVGNCMDGMDCPECTKVMNNIKADAIDDALSLILSISDGDMCFDVLTDRVNELRANNGSTG